VSQRVKKALGLAENKEVELYNKDNQAVEGEWTFAKLRENEGSDLIFFMKKLTINEDGDVVCDEMGKCKVPPQEGQKKINYQLERAKRHKYKIGQDMVM
jgi:ASC-1-like (ASCH) protein